MKPHTLKITALLLAAGIALLALGAAGGLWWAQPRATVEHKAATPSVSPPAERRVLYWYDPMSPQQRFDKPGKSPFMDMELVPKYADDDQAVAALKIDPAVVQNLGMRLAVVTRARLDTHVQATGIVGFNEREVSIVQARSSGFVERVARLAPNDVIGAGALIAEVLVPEWVAVQQDYLALKTLGDVALLTAAVERMRLAGMPEDVIHEVMASGQVRNRVPITAPGGGVIQELGVRPGMTLVAGQTLARINGIGTVWLEVAVPQAQAGEVRVGQHAEARFAAFPGHSVAGRVTALLPSLNDVSRTLRVRIELPNRDGRLRPGLTAQVSLKGDGDEAVLRVPTEAVIRTGRRALLARGLKAGDRVHIGIRETDTGLVVEKLEKTGGEK
jgi:Cu(I)/Ag(I) efflux system membrane fusion protein